MSTGSDSLSDQAETLQNSVSFFKLTGMREQGQRQAPASSRKKAFMQKVTRSRPTSTGKAKPSDGGGFDIEIGADAASSDRNDSDFTSYQ